MYDNLSGIRLSPESNLTAGGMLYATDPPVLSYLKSDISGKNLSMGTKHYLSANIVSREVREEEKEEKEKFQEENV